MIAQLSHVADQILDNALDMDIIVKEGDAGLTKDQILALARPFGVRQHEFHKHFGFCYVKEQAINLRLSSVLGFGWSKVVEGRQYIAPQEPTVKIGDLQVSLTHAYPGGYELYNQGNAVMVSPRAEKPGESASGFNGDGESLLNLPVGTPQGRPVNFDTPMVIAWGYIEHNGVRRHSIGGDILLNLGKEVNTRLLNTYKGADTDLFKRCARYWLVGLYLTELSTVDYAVTDSASLLRFLHEKFPDDRRFMSADAARELMMDDLNQAYPKLFPDPAAVRNALAELRINFTSLDHYYAVYRRLIAWAESQF